MSFAELTPYFRSKLVQVLPTGIKIIGDALPGAPIPKIWNQVSSNGYPIKVIRKGNREISPLSSFESIFALSTCYYRVVPHTRNDHDKSNHGPLMTRRFRFAVRPAGRFRCAADIAGCRPAGYVIGTVVQRLQTSEVGNHPGHIAADYQAVAVGIS
jgi:hypothetical protein